MPRFSVFAAGAALLVSTIACQSTSDVATDAPAGESTTEIPMPGEGITVRTGHGDWLQEVFLVDIVNIGLEELGYNVAEPVQAAYSALHLSVANGELDYNPSFYDPSALGMFENSGGAEKLTLLGELVPAQAGYLIDKATAEEYQITTVEQLQDPELAQLFDTDGDGKANLAGCPTGTGCNERVHHHIDVYGLQDTVEQDEASTTVMSADVVTRYGQGKPVLFYGYNPHWIFAILKLDEDAIWLEVPFTDLPGDQAGATEEETTFNGKNLGIPPVSQRIIANPEFLAENPSAQRWFELVNVPPEALNEESLLIYEGENTPDDIRRHAEEWVEANREQVDMWLDEAQQAAN
ncbi:MAG: glycine betaine/L-proline ABC transporter substrate-binding protein ProX [Cyanothece sp. SIO2G6]|nr:glycine betaine/L-proline ABC transporter substrate-binding protein ProX [Cyanothece sp. SIO2G6]